MIVLILGFPIALILSWAFEITPEGIKRESEITPDESITHHTGRKIVGLTVVLAILATGLFVYGLVRPKGGATSQSTLVTPSIVAAGPIPEKSIAVLPFDNLSSDKENTYFAEGIQDEILTRLSKIGALKVISRTSTQKYQSAPGNLREIGQQLGVAHVLEGSVQKIANAVHINVQLIKAATDEHLWAESYNRKLDDVFGVEGEVASAIADQLKTQLSGAEQKAVLDKPTQNVPAYDAYLRGLSIEHNDYSYTAYARAASVYAEAVASDPNFGLAWARLAVLRSFLYFNAVDRNTNTPAAVQAAADRAMSLAPDAGESWTAQGAYRYRVLRDFEGAVASYKQAQARLPNNAYVLQNLAFVLRRVGRWEEAEATFKKAIELDPRDVSLLTSLGGEFYNYLRRFDDARAALDRALALSPDAQTPRANRAGVDLSEGRLEEAAAILSKIPDEASTEDFVLSNKLNLALYQRHFDAAIGIVEQKLRAVTAGQPLDSIVLGALVQMGFCQEWTGKHDDARQTFTRVVKALKPTPDTVVLPEANGLPSTLAFAYAGLGDKERALTQAAQAVKDYETDAVNRPSAEISQAQIQALFGNHDAAIAALPHLLQVPAGLTTANLKFDPFWDPLRKDPRFQKLLAEPAPATK